MIDRKLLLADDSVTIQKVIALTFADEGMEVRTVGDGERAVRVLEEFTPDIVLADVLMPGLDGYELCEFIKHSERFQQIPVMLLVGSFEPFDEAEARRVGADDVLTKPFQSIRQLVNRVGSLLGGKPAEESLGGGFSTLGLAQTSAPVRVSFAEKPVEPTPVTAEECDVEMQTADTLTAEEKERDLEMQTTDTLRPTRVAAEENERDLKLQTADTLRPTRVTAEEKKRDLELQTADTLRRLPVAAMAAEPAAATYHNFEAQPVNMLTAEEATVSTNEDVVLDLDDFMVEPVVEDSILDLEYIDSVELTAPSATDSVPPLPETVKAAPATEITQEHEPAAEFQSQTVIADWPAIEDQAAVEDRRQGTSVEANDVELSPGQKTTSELSPAAVDAIAQCVVEKLSDKVVREIAWEVVPELAELLIKQRMDEQRQK